MRSTRSRPKLSSQPRTWRSSTAARPRSRSTAETERFYREVLDFTLTDYVDIQAARAVFLHVNPRHHSLAFAELPMRVQEILAPESLILCQLIDYPQTN